MSISVTGGSVFDRVSINKNAVNNLKFDPSDWKMITKTAAAKIMKLPAEEIIQLLAAMKEPTEAPTMTFYCLEKGKATAEVGSLDEVKYFEGQGWSMVGTAVRQL